MDMSNKTNEFSNLPLIEARINLAAKDLDMSFGVISDLAQRLRDLLPTAMPATTHFTPPGAQPTLSDAMVLQNEQSGVKIVLQKGGCVVAWNRPLPEVGPSYPRFPVLLDHFEKMVDAYQAAKSEAVDFTACNMAYTNFIAADDPAGEVVSKYVSGDWIPTGLGEESPISSLSFGWHRADDSDLRVSLQHVTIQHKDVSARGYHFTTVAGRYVQGNENIQTAVEINHQVLNEFFPTLITDAAKEEWGFQR